MNDVLSKKEIIPKEKWNKYDGKDNLGDVISRPSYTYLQEAWRRLKKNKIAITALMIIILVSMIATFGPMFSKYDYDEQNLDFASLSFRLSINKIDEDSYVHIANGLRVYKTSESGEILAFIDPVEEDMINKKKIYEIDREKIILDFSKKPIRLMNEDSSEYPLYKKVFNKSFRLGTDKLGRDLLVRLMHGARISLLVALIATIVNCFIGILYGGIAGYLGGWVDNIMIRIVDVLSAVPMMLYIILLMVAIGPGLKTIIIAMGVVFWIGTARLVRGEILSLKSQEYVMAAKTIGVSNFRILTRHLLPNAIGPIMVSLTFMIPDAIFTEAFLSFIGLGIPAPQASWGTLCENALEGLQTYPYQLFFPAAAISITILAFNLLGDGLRDALDPRLRK